MKKVLVAVALFASMAMVSCGAPSADTMVEKINACTSVEELNKLGQDKDWEEAYEKMSPEDKQKVNEAATKKSTELAGDLMKNALNGLME